MVTDTSNIGFSLNNIPNENRNISLTAQSPNKNELAVGGNGRGGQATNEFDTLCY